MFYQRSFEVSSGSQNAGESLSQPWKDELNARLAATRSRRSHKAAQQASLPGLEEVSQKVESRASRLAAKVAERYANAPSYSDVIAAELRAQKQAAAVAPAPAVKAIPVVSQDAGFAASKEELLSKAVVVPDDLEIAPVVSPEEVVEEPIPIVPLAVNVIEIPRELVASRKARPRREEGPLRETADAEGRSQLKIFEVEQESISQTVSIGSAALHWSPIRLEESDSSPAPQRGVALPTQTPFKTASLEDRIMAGIFDLALVIAAFAIFVLVFVSCTAHPPVGKPAALAAGGVLVGFGLLYQLLFFRFSESTPGMRYARIALCTFEDENPSRKAMCRRVYYGLLSAAPLGLGFLWALFDGDRLSWHDRLTRCYQRSY
jgi:uncharacterized RDD family membrane protein YckC